MTTTHDTIRRLAQTLALDPGDDDAQGEMLRVLGRLRRERRVAPGVELEGPRGGFSAEPVHIECHPIGDAGTMRDVINRGAPRWGDEHDVRFDLDSMQDWHASLRITHAPDHLVPAPAPTVTRHTCDVCGQDVYVGRDPSMTGQHGHVAHEACALRSTAPQWTWAG